MAQGQGDSVGGIVGLGHFRKTQKPLGHIHDLVLGCVAVAHNGLFDLGRFVGSDFQSRLTNGQENDPSCLGNTDAGGDVLTEEQLFDGHHIRLGYLEKLPHVLVDDLESCGEIHTGGGGDGTAPQQLKFTSLGIHQAEADDAVTGVNA